MSSRARDSHRPEKDLEADLQQMQALLAEHRAQEKALLEVLRESQRHTEQVASDAKQEAEGLVADARREAEGIVASARTAADDMLADARAGVSALHAEIEFLRARRLELIDKLESAVQTLTAALPTGDGSAMEPEPSSTEGPPLLPASPPSSDTGPDPSPSATIEAMPGSALEVFATSPHTAVSPVPGQNGPQARKTYHVKVSKRIVASLRRGSVMMSAALLLGVGLIGLIALNAPDVSETRRRLVATTPEIARTDRLPAKRPDAEAASATLPVPPAASVGPDGSVATPGIAEDAGQKTPPKIAPAIGRHIPVNAAPVGPLMTPDAAPVPVVPLADTAVAPQITPVAVPPAAVPLAERPATIPQPPARRTEPDIASRDREWFDAFYRNDSAAMNRVVSQDFELVDDRASTRAGRRTRGAAPVSRRLSDVQTQVFGDGAILTARMNEEVGTGPGEDSLISEVWIRQNGEWRLMSLRLGDPKPRDP